MGCGHQDFAPDEMPAGGFRSADRKGSVTMASRSAKLLLFGFLLLVPAWAAAGDDAALSSAYAAILRGDTDAGRAALGQLLAKQDTAEVEQARGWLDSYHNLVVARGDLKSETFKWNVDQAHKALDEDKPFLALSFAAQAASYAADPNAYGNEPWVRALRERSLAAAREQTDAEHWSKALSHYAVLERIYPKDEELTKLRDATARHARVEVLYKDEKSLKEHIKGADRDLLRNAVKAINDYYWQEPNFKKAAAGALDNLLTLCGATKVRGFLDGLANPVTRAHFVARLSALKADVDSAQTFTYQDLRRLFNSVAEANKESVELPDGLVVVEFVEGMDDKLDEYTSVIWPSEARDFDTMMMGGFEGVGIQLGLDERSDRLKVVTPLENSPALEAGIQPDDLIVAVDGQTTKGWSTEDAVKNIMGPAGTKVVLTILRPRTGERLPFPLVRRNIVLTSVRGVQRLPGDANAWDFMLDKDAGIAYIRLTNFLPGSHTEVSHALAEATHQGMKALVLDVRHNPGGLLDVAVEIVSNFVAQGEVVSTRGREKTDSEVPVTGKAPYKDLPLLVLVNEASASASEILAGALQDHHRAVILGERTFGKGSVQHVRPLGGGDARIKLTTALYYLPSGRSPHKLPQAERWGVDPDWNLKLTPKEFRRVLEQERNSYVIHNESPESANKPLSTEERDKVLADLKADQKDEDDDLPPLLSDADIKQLEADPYDAPKSDPQLDTALLMLRIKLAANTPWPRDLAAAEKPGSSTAP
jgi:carboxyl-terminal processing protease